MRLRKALELAWNTLIHSKLRSWLTIIGIVIGIAAVVSIISVSQGAEMSLTSQLNGLGTNIITVSPGAERSISAGANFVIMRGGSAGASKGNQATQAAKNLTNNDVNILKTVSNVKYVMGTYSGRAQMTYLGSNASVSIEGVDTQLWSNFITGINLAEGRYLTQSDSYSVVIGSNVANQIFSGISVNQNIIINGTIFRVVGILNQSGGQYDSEVFMPIAPARQVLDDVGGTDFSSISVEVSNSNTTQINQTITDITDTLMMERGILQQKNVDFSVSSPISFQQTISSALSSLSLFLEAIAAISLLVGAIGISNTMFTSVLEKTKEIGIMKAVGAKNRDILMIFLFKAGMLGLIGGVGGAIIGISGSLLIGQAVGISLGRTSITSYINPWVVIGAFLISMLIGMIAGAIPAYRASKLSPIEALRYE